MPNSEARSESTTSLADSAILTPSSESSHAYDGPPAVEKLAEIVKEICKRLPWHLGGNFHKLSEQISQMGGMIAAEARESSRLRSEVDRLSAEVVALKNENTDRLSERISRLEGLVATEAQASSRHENEVHRLSKEVTDLREENLEQQEQIADLQNHLGMLPEESIADKLRQLEFKKGSVKFLQKNESDGQNDPEGNPQEDQNISLKGHSNLDEHPGNSRPDEKLPGLQGQLNEQKEMMSRLIEINEERLFEPQRVGFFDPDSLILYQEPVHAAEKDGYVYYRNVELFIEAAEVAARTVPVRALQRNLQHCLTGSARTWYVSVLTTDERDKASTGHGLSNWAELLRKKWDHKWTERQDTRPLKLTDAPEFCHTHMYGYSVMENLLATVRFARELGVHDTQSQLLLFYDRMKSLSRDSVDAPHKEDTLNDFIARTDLTLWRQGRLSCRREDV